jgi:hypothetical protein
MFSYKNKNYKNILEQIKNSTVKSRESSTAWFFTEIIVKHNEDYRLDYKGSLTFWDIGLDLWSENIMWFLFFIEDWYINLMEWYTYDYQFSSFDELTNIAVNVQSKRIIPFCLEDNIKWLFWKIKNLFNK